MKFTNRHELHYQQQMLARHVPTFQGQETRDRWFAVQATFRRPCNAAPSIQLETKVCHTDRIDRHERRCTSNAGTIFKRVGIDSTRVRDFAFLQIRNLVVF